MKLFPPPVCVCEWGYRGLQCKIACWGFVHQHNHVPCILSVDAGLILAYSRVDETNPMYHISHSLPRALEIRPSYVGKGGYRGMQVLLLFVANLQVGNHFSNTNTCHVLFLLMLDWLWHTPATPRTIRCNISWIPTMRHGNKPEDL